METPTQELIERLAAAEREIDWLYEELRRRDDYIQYLTDTFNAHA